MIELIKKYKIILISTVAVIIILAIAFFAGGNSSTNNHPYVANNTEESSVSDITECTSEAFDSQSTSQATSKALEIDKAVIETSNLSNKQNQETTKNKSKQHDISTTASTVSNYKENTSSVTEINTAPKPVEPHEQIVNKDNKLNCFLSISCKTILDNISKASDDIIEIVPTDGWILKPQTFDFYDGESVSDVLSRVCKENKIHLELSYTPIYNSAYVEGINNIYEFDCGEGSGWEYKVNGVFADYGCSRYKLSNGDKIEFIYTCNFGKDIEK